MKIKLEIEIDTENEQDLNTIEELMEKLRELKELMYESNIKDIGGKVAKEDERYVVKDNTHLKIL